MAFIPCYIKQLPTNKVIKAARTALRMNPANAPRTAAMLQPSPAKLAVMISKRWPASGVRLSVSFVGNWNMGTRHKIIDHMNAWGKSANVIFVMVGDGGKVRIAREPDGYWSYLGTDVLEIPANYPTMNLQDFGPHTPESEFYRVVRHETGHTLGFPHEHARRTIIDRIDVKKALAYFMSTQGWSAEDVRQQVLTPLERIKIKGSYRVDETSIMAYRLPGTITKDGRPIIGGRDITESDYRFAAAVYPKIHAQES